MHRQRTRRATVAGDGDCSGVRIGFGSGRIVAGKRHGREAAAAALVIGDVHRRARWRANGVVRTCADGADYRFRNFSECIVRHGHRDVGRGLSRGNRHRISARNTIVLSARRGASEGEIYHASLSDFARRST